MAAALDASDFDHDRLREAVANNPLEAVRIITEVRRPVLMESPITITIEYVLADEAIRMLMAFGAEGRRLLAFGAEDQNLSLELIAIGDAQYLRGVTESGPETPWLATSTGIGVPALIVAAGVDDLIDRMIPGDNQAPFTAVGMDACGEGRHCFVLTRPLDPLWRLLVDTQTYLPAAIRGPALERSVGPDVETRVEWNAGVSISAPADAQQSLADELRPTLIWTFFGSSGLGQMPVEGSDTVVAAGVERGQEAPVVAAVIREFVRELPVEVVVTREIIRETPVEGVTVPESEAFWRLFGASPYGEAIDEIGDQFRGNPDSSPARHDPKMDIWSWGVGRVELAQDTARALFGPDGAFPCGSFEPLDPVVACGADGVSPGDYLVIWIEVLNTIVIFDPRYVRTFWALFQDGDPANDWEARPHFAGDVLDGSDSHYWIVKTPGGWELRRTFGPQLEPMPTDGAAMILANVVLLLVPVSELGDLDTLRLGVASFSGPITNPYGVNATLDRSPEPRQPLMPLDEVGF